jgi:cytochrome c-type biogenesis protein
MLERLNILTAFLAGLLSFFSPCTLPLVPLFLGHLVGMTGDELAEAGARAGRPRGVLLSNAAAFVLGFSLVFVVLFGLTAGVLARLMIEHRGLLLQVGGAFLVVLGLNYLGLLHIPALWRERRVSWRALAARRKGGHWPTSLLVGATFALGWTPCVGAILATITTLAATGRGPVQAVALLAVYSLGLGLPFLLVAAGFGRAAALLRRVQRHFHALSLASGALIVLVGVFMLLGAYQAFFVRLIRLVPWTPPL